MDPCVGVERALFDDVAMRLRKYGDVPDTQRDETRFVAEPSLAADTGTVRPIAPRYGFRRRVGFNDGASSTGASFEAPI